MTDNRRTRVQSLPTAPLPADQRIFESEIEEENFEADDEISHMASRRPSTVAKEEIAQARRLSERLNDASQKSSPVLLVNSTDTNLSTSSTSSKQSLLGSIYSLGGAVWSFIRGTQTNDRFSLNLLGPVDTVSNDDLVEHRRHRSQSFSFQGTRQPLKPVTSDESMHSDSSEAPNFNLAHVQEFDHSPSKMRSVAEAGRGKISFKMVEESACNLIGRDFPEEEFLLSSRDISTVNKDSKSVLIFFRFNPKFPLVGMFTLIGFYFTAPEVTASPSQLCTTNLDLLKVLSSFQSKTNQVPFSVPLLIKAYNRVKATTETVNASCGVRTPLRILLLNTRAPVKTIILPSVNRNISPSVVAEANSVYGSKRRSLREFPTRCLLLTMSNFPLIRNLIVLRLKFGDSI